MTYQEAMERLSQAKVLGSVLGLSTMRRLLQALGNPQEKLKFVHIAGTNGKGSTAAYLSAMLQAAGYRTGLYISPYIQRFGERIQVDSACITEAEIAACMGPVADAADEIEAQGHQAPTVFELVTAMGFLHFLRRECDLVVLEVGLGGRLDATNAIGTPEVAVITQIGFDHTELLGDTLAQIAGEKAGIIKPGCDVVLYGQEAEAIHTVERVCREQGARLHMADARGARLRAMTVDGLTFDWEGCRALETALTGLHQVRNAVTAVRTARVLSARGWSIGEAAIYEGLRSARCIGRMELLSRTPMFFVDGAHNPQGVAALMESLRLLFPEKKLHFIMGVLADKDYPGAVAEALPLAQAFYTITPPIDRALPAPALAGYIRSRGSVPTAEFPSTRAAIEAALRAAGEEGVICAFGSLYQIAAIRNFFK